MSEQNLIIAKKISAEKNENEMRDWLIENERLLPLSIYQIMRHIGWSYGKTRSTLFRLMKKKRDLIRIEEVADPKKKRFRTYVCLVGTPSEDRLGEKMAASYSESPEEKSVDDQNLNSGYDISVRKIIDKKDEEIKFLSDKVHSMKKSIIFLMDFFQKHKSLLQHRITDEERSKFMEIVKILQEGD